MKIVHVIILQTLLIISSCKKNNNNTLNKIKLETIKVDAKKDIHEEGDFNTYFSSYELVALETNKQSLFSRINRVFLFKERIFILDKDTKSVLVFSNKGKFINKIQNIGRGPNEYRSIMDFTIDEKNHHILLYTDSPVKLLTYDLDCNFIKSMKTDKLYRWLSSHDNKRIFINGVARDENNMIKEENIDTKENQILLEKNSMDKMFVSYGLFTPTITKTEKTYISAPYSDTIYQYDKSGLGAKYFIDFGKNKISSKTINNIGTPREISSYAREKNLGFGVSNFRNVKNHLVFSYTNHPINIYSKKDKSLTSFKRFFKHELPFLNYFAHSGNDNKIISILSASSFKTVMKYSKEKSLQWKEIPNYIKDINGQIKLDSNPLLMIYTFKD